MFDKKHKTKTNKRSIYDYITALTIAGVDTLRSRREELTRRFFTRPTRAEGDIPSSLLAAAKVRREHYSKTQKK